MDTPKRRPKSRASKKRDPIRPVARRRLFSFDEQGLGKAVETWSSEENKALVQFVLFHGPEDVWPLYSKSSKFWSEAALFIQRAGRSTAKRTGSANLYHNMLVHSDINNIITGMLHTAGACRLRIIQISKAICHSQIG